MKRGDRIFYSMTVILIIVFLWAVFGAGMLLSILHDNHDLADRLTVGGFATLVWFLALVGGVVVMVANARDWINKDEK